VGEIFENPIHPYTRGLLNCVPKLGTTKETQRFTPIRGRVPEPGEVPEISCVFEPRCDYAIEECKTANPRLVEGKGGHAVRCILADKLRRGKGYKTSPGKKRGKVGEPKEIKRESFLDVENIKVYYPYRHLASDSGLFGIGEKKSVKAVDDISLHVREGLTVGIVGESGCGKSTLARGIIGLEEVTDGGGDFVGFDLSVPLSDRDMEFIQKMQMVFQNPDSTLNPSYYIGAQIARPIKKFRTVPRDKVREEVIRLLASVKLGEDFYSRYPRQLSGGEKQRVGVARALASRPDLVILDEPLSSLDVSVQASVINLLLEIQEERGTTMVFIAHDLSVVRFLSDDVVVMYLGKIVERGPAKSIYAPPYHPYTEALLSAVPVIDTKVRKKRIRLVGEIPSAIDPPRGCRFHTRCHRKEMLPDGGKICEEKEPPWRKSEGGGWILCHIPLEMLSDVEPIVTEASAK
jgi:peptide/nickel transport system ATP-binding protein